MKQTFALIVAFFLCGLATAQTLVVTVNPNVVYPGQIVTINYTSTGMVSGTFEVKDATTNSVLNWNLPSSATVTYSTAIVGTHTIQVSGATVNGGTMAAFKTFTVLPQPLPGLTVNGNPANNFSFNQPSVYQNIWGGELNCVGQFQTNAAGGFQFGNVTFSFYNQNAVQGFRLITSSDATFGNYQDTFVTSGMLLPQYSIPYTMFPGDRVYLQLQILISCGSSVGGDEIEVRPFTTWGNGGNIAFGNMSGIQLFVPNKTFEVKLDSAVQNWNSLHVVGSYDFSDHLFPWDSAQTITVMYGDTFQIPVFYTGNNNGVFDTTFYFSGNNTIPTFGYTIATSHSYHGCVDATDFIQTSYVGNVAIDEPTVSDFVVYPNPASNQTTFASDLGTYKVLNMQGQVVLMGETNVDETTIDVSQLSSGLHMIQVTPGGGSCGGCSGHKTAKLVIE